MNISVIIPVYKNKKAFIENLIHNSKFLKGCEIIIIDDYSRQKIKKDIKKINTKIKVIVNCTNLGYGRSVNKGLAIASGEYIILLNSDVILKDDSYHKAIDFLKNNPDYFAVSFGQIEKDGRLVGKNKIYYYQGLYYHQKAADNKKGENGWAEGGTTVVRKSMLDQLNGYDPIYSPFYWEDIDLSYRAKIKGWKILFDPDIKVIHHHQSTISKYYQPAIIKQISIRNQYIFFWKNIKEKRLKIKHLFYLPFNLLKAVIKLDFDYIKGFIKACKLYLYNYFFILIM